MSQLVVSTIAALSLSAVLSSGPALSDSGHVAHRKPPADLAARYAACAAEAERRPLHRSEAEACAAIYFRLKMSLLGLKRESYEAMSISERATANAQGYQAFLGWRATEHGATH